MKLLVGDVVIEVFARGDCPLGQYFLEMNKEPQVQVFVSEGFIMDGSQPEPTYDDYMDLTIFGDGHSPAWYVINRHLGFIAGDVSDTYRFIHGAGFRLNNKGVLLVGNSGTGKTTLTSLLSDEILDDDLLLATPTEIRRLGYAGVINRPEQGYFDILEGQPESTGLDYIFVLNNAKPPTHLRPLDPANISPELTFDDRIHPALFDRYRERMPVTFKGCEAYEVGTAQNPEMTCNVIRALVFSR